MIHRKTITFRRCPSFSVAFVVQYLSDELPVNFAGLPWFPLVFCRFPSFDKPPVEFSLPVPAKSNTKLKSKTGRSCKTNAKIQRYDNDGTKKSGGGETMKAEVLVRSSSLW